MVDIALQDAMIVWTPNTELWKDIPNAAPAGSVRVVKHPDEEGIYTPFPKSDGACTGDWRDVTDGERLERLRVIRAQMVNDGVAESDINAAFGVIPEARYI